jgi:hypothetical protein
VRRPFHGEVEPQRELDHILERGQREVWAPIAEILSATARVLG